VTIMLAVDAAGLESGSLELFPGQHRAVLRAPADAPLDVAEDAVDLASGYRTTMLPGDGLAFHGLTPHRSAPNRSAAYRRALFFTYNAARYGQLSADFYAKRDRRGADSAQP
jgi:2-aminoethylphosphonate dioxygenase